MGQPRLAHTDSHVSRHEWHHKQQHLFKERQRAKRQRVKERRVANRVVGVATGGETNHGADGAVSPAAQAVVRDGAEIGAVMNALGARAENH